MKKENVLFVVIALIVGILFGYLIFAISGKKASQVPGGGVPVGAGTPADYSQRISEAEKIVARDPKNVQAWIQLGNDYFDTSQPQKAIEAYSKALEIQPDNPNVLTDQGIMYRQVGWFDKALANFEKAQKLEPGHLQSLYNMGVVYAEDLKQPDKALKAWGQYLERDSSSPGAQQIKGFVEQLKAGSSGRK